jgi:hypothetical protein
MLNQQSTIIKSPNYNELTSIKTPHDYVFTRWMGSWEHLLSLWSNDVYSDALLAYIGKIYGQQANIYHYFNKLWNESLYNSNDELDLLNILIQRLSKIPGRNSLCFKSY